MNKFVYPAVFYYDQNSKTYCAAIDDLALYTVGDTVEDAHKNASAVLETFVSTSLKYDFEIPTPSSFDELILKHPKNLVMLVECSV